MAALRRLGPFNFARLALHNLILVLTGRYREHRYAYDTAFDRKYGVNTAGTVEVVDLEAPDDLKASAARYEVVDPGFFEFLLQRARVSQPEQKLFVDLGSGKGRALLLAAQAGFRRVVGVELDPGLHSISQSNIENFRSRCPGTDFDARQGDATKFEFPAVPTILFLNNPFDGHMVERVLANAEREQNSAEPDFLLIYGHSNHERLVRERPGWTELDRGSFRGGRQFYSIFRWQGHSPGSEAAQVY